MEDIFKFFSTDFNKTRVWITVGDESDCYFKNLPQYLVANIESM